MRKLVSGEANNNVFPNLFPNQKSRMIWIKEKQETKPPFSIKTPVQSSYAYVDNCKYMKLPRISEQSIYITGSDFPPSTPLPYEEFL